MGARPDFVGCGRSQTPDSPNESPVWSSIDRPGRKAAEASRSYRAAALADRRPDTDLARRMQII